MIYICLSAHDYSRSGGYVGLRVVGGKNLNNRMLAKVLTVRLGSPADLLTSVKPGQLSFKPVGKSEIRALLAVNVLDHYLISDLITLTSNR